ncbi:MAG TPA: type II toxin-antitoxin system RelE/ParE family toxin [Gemmataceae bacterium]|jgi:plasmid stabilization system protein ParE|nr:type II toxin-antitoxin system RelE/ParE family toxin [Gemmataceae bacterium]
MTLPVILRPEAEQDLGSAEAWYEQQRTGLGAAFLARVSVALDQIAAMPELYGIIWHDVRFCRLRRFPYVVYYRALADRVEVLAVLHGNRDPSVWQSRA